MQLWSLGRMSAGGMRYESLVYISKMSQLICYWFFGSTGASGNSVYRRLRQAINRLLWRGGMEVALSRSS